MSTMVLIVPMLLVALMRAGTAHAGPDLLVYGDSLSAAYGIAQKEGWVTLLEQRLKQKRSDYTVANASISGETSSGGASRIEATLAQYRPRIVVVALGANDGLRGLPVAQMRDNLSAIIRASQKAGARVLLVGMKMPPNYGPQYTREFELAFAALSKQHKTAFVPFLFEGIADKEAMFQADRLHPVQSAQPHLLDNVWQVLKPLLGPPGKTG